MKANKMPKQSDNYLFIIVYSILACYRPYTVTHRRRDFNDSWRHIDD